MSHNIHPEKQKLKRKAEKILKSPFSCLPPPFFPAAPDHISRVTLKLPSSPKAEACCFLFLIIFDIFFDGNNIFIFPWLWYNI